MRLRLRLKNSRRKNLRKLKNLVDVASGRKKADAVIKNVDLVNVLTEEIYQCDIAIYGNLIAGVGNYRGMKEIDGKGCLAVPGLIDGHTHIEMSMLTLSEFSKLVVPRGNTAVVADPHEIANVLGREGILLMLEEAKTLPIRFFCMLPSCVPSSDLETSGAKIGIKDLEELFNLEDVLGLAEVMDYSHVISGDEEILSKIEIARPRPIDGHAPFLSRKDLNAYVVAGIGSDHESITTDEAKEKLRLGMRVMVREGSMVRNLRDLRDIVKTGNRNVMLVTDGDRNLKDIFEEGYLDYVYRMAVEEGVDPLKALQMCTLNPATWFGLNCGQLTPGRYADIVLLRNLEKFEVKAVFIDGKRVDKIRKTFTYPEFAKNSVRAVKLKPDNLRIEQKGKCVRVMKLIEGEIATDEVVVEAEMALPERDILKLVVVERHTGSGRVGKGLVSGFGLKRGAIASSIAHDSHNIIAVGVDDESICGAVNRVIELNGGIVVYDDSVKAEIQFEIAGLMTESSAEETLQKLERIHASIKELGCKLKSPLITLSFLALPVIPKLKVTDFGLVDVEKGEVVDIFV